MEFTQCKKCIFHEKSCFKECFIIDRNGTMLLKDNSQCAYYTQRYPDEPKPKNPFSDKLKMIYESDMPIASKEYMSSLMKGAEKIWDDFFNKPKPKEIEKIPDDKLDSVLFQLPKTKEAFLIVEGITIPILNKVQELIDAVNELRQDRASSIQ